MRITQSIITRTILNGINQSHENMNIAQQNIATGKMIHKPSDNPLGFTRVARYRQMINQNEKYMENITNSNGWLSTTSSALNHILDRVIEAKEYATQGANDTLNATNRAALAGKVDGLIDEVVSLANTKYLGKNLFAGTKTKVDSAFDWSGDTLTYNGNNGKINRKIGASLSVTININGNQLANTGLFTTLANLRDALNDNDQSATRDMISSLRDVSDQIASLASGVGSIQNHMEMARQRLDTANINLASYLSQIEDTDVVEAITRYNNEEISYNAALRTASNVIRTNLLDFLR